MSGEEKLFLFYDGALSRDKLGSIFLNLQGKDLGMVGILAQRLNIGFSRSKETMHFVPTNH